MAGARRVNFDVTCEGNQNWSKILSMDILRVFDNHHMWQAGHLIKFVERG